jgi:hypothetical protein
VTSLVLTLLAASLSAGCGEKTPAPSATPPAPSPPAGTDDPAPVEEAAAPAADDQAGELVAGDEGAVDEGAVDEGGAAPAAGDEPAPVDAAIAEATALLTPGPRAKALCAKQEACGCNDAGCEAELAEFEGAVPDTAWACIIDQGCETLCTGEGTKACLAPVGDAFQANLRSSRIDRYCARHVQCGCALEGCRDNLGKVEQAEVIEYAACATRLGCPAVCEEGTKEVAAGMVAFDQCLAPILARMNTTHRVNMSIIRSIGSTNSRRVYDANGNYLYTE